MGTSPLKPGPHVPQFMGRPLNCEEASSCVIFLKGCLFVKWTQALPLGEFRGLHLFPSPLLLPGGNSFSGFCL